MSTRNRPNILMLVFDSLSEAALQAHMDELPTLRGLQSKSLRFSQAFVCSPESSPSRASLFTGLDMAAHGLWTDGVALPKRETPLPEVFAQNGYHSWLVGRRHLAGVSHWTTEHARACEYHHFDWAHGPLHRSRQNAYLNWLQQTEPQTYAAIFPRQADPDDAHVAPSQLQAMADVPDRLSFNAWIAHQACARLRNDAPFFGVLGFVVGQSMGGSGAVVEAMQSKALRQADAALATVLAQLPEETIIIVTAARGCVDNSPSAQPLQHSAIHVPLMLCAPDVGPETKDALVSTMDIAPTLYALAGLPAPRRLQGQSLISTRARGWALCRMRNPDHSHQTALMSAHWKLVTTHAQTQDTCLFDLTADPAETNDLAAAPAHQNKLEEMVELMIDARIALEDRTEPRIANF